MLCPRLTDHKETRAIAPQLGAALIDARTAAVSQPRFLRPTPPTARSWSPCATQDLVSGKED